MSLTTSKTTTFTTTGTAGIGIDTHLVKFNASGAVSYAVAKTRTVTNTVVFPSIPVGKCAAAFELVDQYAYNLTYWWNSGLSVKAGTEKHLDGITIQWVNL